MNSQLSSMRREMENNNKSQDIMGQLTQQPYPININININNSKKEGDIFQRNSANISSKGLGKRVYNINKGQSNPILYWFHWDYYSMRQIKGVETTHYK